MGTSHWRGQSGASAVEFALVLPVLIMLLFGTMWGAALFNTQQTVNQAAREGARYGAILPLGHFGGVEPPPADAWFDEISERVVDVLANDMPLAHTDAATVCVRFYDEGNNPTARGDGCPDPSAAGATEGARVEVTVRQPARLEFGVGAVESITVGGSGIARYEPSLDEDD